MSMHVTPFFSAERKPPSLFTLLSKYLYIVACQPYTAVLKVQFYNGWMYQPHGELWKLERLGVINLSQSSL